MRHPKRFLAALLGAALMLTGCSASNHSYYEQGQLYLGGGDFDTAAMIFHQLGEYRDSADYALYARALSAMEEEAYDTARATFILLEDFKSSKRYVQYLDAVALEEANSGEAALAAYEALGRFEDSEKRAARLREKLPEDRLSHARALMNAGRYEQALTLLEGMNGYGESESLITACRAAMDQAAYNRAEALYASGQYAQALAAFEALGDTLDAAARTLACRSAMYTALEEDYHSASLLNAEELIDRYSEMEGYLDSETRIESLQRRFGPALQLLAGGEEPYWVTFGHYPWGESGLPSALTWQVVAIDGMTATLLGTAAIDASTKPEIVQPTLTEKEAAALVSISLPTAQEMTGLELNCPASPYAMAQGVPYKADGSCWWYLQDGTLISSGGNQLSHGEEVTAGIRLMARVTLTDGLWTQGEGTAESPFR